MGANRMTPKRIIKWVMIGIITIITVPLFFMISGINDSGFRTVVQYPFNPLGKTVRSVFEAGVYFQGLGEHWTYPDAITFDFDKSPNLESATVDQKGVAVRYQDGGTGTVYGIARFVLPETEEDMLNLHRKYRSANGVGFKAIKPTVETIVNHTAGLMTSEESYAERRGNFIEMVKDQLRNGPYLTVQKPITEIEGGFEYCLEPNLAEELEEECKKAKRTTKMVPVIKLGKDGQPMHDANELAKYSLYLEDVKIVDWDYEPRTIEQISEKRKAQMAIITAKANAERAKQDAITAEQQGLANVMTAKYEQEVEKERQVVIAEREKEVAVIAAQKLVDVAEQQKLEQEQKKLAMAEYKQAETLRGEGDAAYKRQVIEADGALAQKLATYEAVMGRFATAVAAQKWVPEIVMQGSEEGAPINSAQNLIDMFSVKTAKDLALDMSIKQ